MQNNLFQTITHFMKYADIYVCFSVVQRTDMLSLCCHLSFFWVAKVIICFLHSVSTRIYSSIMYFLCFFIHNFWVSVFFVELNVRVSVIQTAWSKMRHTVCSVYILYNICTTDKNKTKQIIASSIVSDWIQFRM